ncbi:MAG: FixH family protein [Lentisphaeraceae bacterium]|nr:FixH family protein [Lentisphaeraceae bacterium]
MKNETEKEAQKKSYWGIGIIIAYACFMSMILTLVFKTTGKRPELVSDDYYKKGVSYQAIIEARKNADSLAQKPQLIQSEMLLKIPKESEDNFINGKLYLLRPNDKNMDREINIDKAENIKLPKLQSGVWQLSLNWQDSQNKQYNMQWNIYK